MYFGEILEPSTRELTEDDYEDYPESKEYAFEWKGCSDVPANLETLVCLESSKVLKIFKTYLLKDSSLVCKLKNEAVNIYCETSEGTESPRYIIAFGETNDFGQAEIVEELAPWIKRSKNLITFTSAPIASYQNNNMKNRCETQIRVLTTKRELSYGYDRLETPNLITGVSGGVLSYCVHINRDCSSFIAYMDSTPIDSLNSHALLVLAKQVGLVPEIPKIRNEVPQSNLYM